MKIKKKQKNTALHCELRVDHSSEKKCKNVHVTQPIAGGKRRRARETNESGDDAITDERTGQV